VGQSSLIDERFRGCGIQMSIFPTRILLATDASKEAGLAARTAADLADKTSSELHVVHVLDVTSSYLAYPAAASFDGTELEDPVLEEDLRRISEQRAGEMLNAEAERIRSAGVKPAQTYLREGVVPQEIVALAEETGAGLIVMGSRGLGGMRRTLTGTVSDSVVRHAPCPVVVVRGDPLSFPTKILLATDGSEDANLASSTAADLAKSTNSELHVVYVGGMPSVLYEPPGAIALDPDLQSSMEVAAEEAAKARLKEQAHKISEAGGEITQTHVRAGYADAEIVGLAEELAVGLIVMGSRGRGGLRRALMGSVSDSVVRHAHCSVLVTRHVPKESADEG
jgi:nucleotide-binding universal stress UspA family protein